MLRFISIVLISLLFFTSCAQRTLDAEKDYESKEYFYSFHDSAANEIILTKKPERVAVLFSSYAEVWQLAGGNIDITVGESIERGFANENCILVDDKSGHTSINHETLIASSPDLVIGTIDHDVQRQTAELCDSAGIPCALFKIENINDYLNVLKIFTEILGTEDNYIKYGSEIKEKTDSLLGTIDKSNKEQKNILFVRTGTSARSTKAKTAKENFVCAMLDELGSCNIADNADILLDSLSLEEIVARDPDIIFITTMGDEAAAKEYMNTLLSENGWGDLNAVKSGNIHFLPKDLFHYKPNARWYDAYLYLAKIIYPEISFEN